MDHHTLFMLTLIRHARVDSPETARRKEHLLRLEREAREARSRRRRERVRRVEDALITLHRTVSHASRGIEAPDLRRAPR